MAEKALRSMAARQILGRGSRCEKASSFAIPNKRRADVAFYGHSQSLFHIGAYRVFVRRDDAGYIEGSGSVPLVSGAVGLRAKARFQQLIIVNVQAHPTDGTDSAAYRGYGRAL
jgi:hypothetical protein